MIPRDTQILQKFHRSTQIDNPGTKANWPFGESIKVTLNPRNMGDLLSNMYIAIEFPGVGVVIRLPIGSDRTTFNKICSDARR